MVESEEDI